MYMFLFLKLSDMMVIFLLFNYINVLNICFYFTEGSMNSRPTWR